MNRAQLVLSDLMIAVFIFFFIFGMLYFSWISGMSYFQKSLDFNQKYVRAIQVSNALLSEGVPSWWSGSDYNVPGLCREYDVIDSNRLAQLTSLDYNTLKSNLGLEGYDFHLTLTKVRGPLVVSYGGDDVNAQNIILVRRIVLYEGGYAVYTFKLW